MNKIIKDIKEALNTDNKTKAYDTQAKVVRSEGQTLWVHIPGGVDETPVKKTINAKAGDTVQVRVSGGSAWLVGNQSAPPTDDTTAIIADRKASEVRGVATLAQELSEKAEQTAISAQISANGKNTIYYNASAPTGGTYKLGDTWFNSSEDNAIYTWNGSSWVKEELGEDAIANLSITNAKIANGTIQNGKIANLDAGKITAGDLSAAVMKTNAVSAINATANKIDAKNINVDGTLIVGASDVESAVNNIEGLNVRMTTSGTNLVFNAILIQGGNDITSTIPDGDFEWFYRTPTGDVPMDLNGKSITIPQTSQEYGRTVVCVWTRNQYAYLLNNTGNNLVTNNGDKLIGRSEY